MRNTPNYNLPQYEGTDKFTKEVLNDAFTKVDTAINDLQETFNVNGSTSTLTTQEVINARNGKQNLKERIDEIDEQYKEIVTNDIPQITEKLDNIELNKAEQTDMLRALGLTDPTKNYKILGCVLRNTGWGWYIIKTENHTPLNIESVSQDGTSVIVNYGFTAKNVISFVATVDETYAKQGVFCGASVGLSTASIQFSQIKSVEGYVRYENGEWKFTSNTGQDVSGITMSFANGILTINHPIVSTDNFSLTGKGGSKINYQLGTLTATSTQVIMTDYTGALITTPNDFMKFYFNRGMLLRLSPDNLVNGVGNIWCYGIMEV